MKNLRQLGLTSATALVVASMIGTGVFTTSGFLLADLGSRWAVLAVWAIGGFMAALGALSYGALARRIPESGGEYLFLSRTVHPAAGFAAGWISLFVGFSAPLAAAAFGFGEYTKYWFGGASPQLTGTLIIVAFALLHSTAVHKGAWVQNLAVLLKIFLILAFVGIAVGQLAPTPSQTPRSFSAGSFAVSLVWVSFSYAGWNAAIYIGGEVRDPERNLPRSLLLGTGTVTLLYLALNAVFLFGAPESVIAGQLEVGRLAAISLGGKPFGEAITALVALALATSVSSLLMAGPRVYARMAADGLLPKWLATEAGPPRAAILLQTLLAIVMLWAAAYDALLTYIGFTLSLSTAATVFGLILLRRREGSLLKVPGWPWVPFLFLILTLWTVAFSISRRPIESLLALLTIAAGVLVWWWRKCGGQAQ